MPQPTNVRDSQCVMVMIIYLNKYSLRLAELVDMLREVTKKNVPFVWGTKYSKECKGIKMLLPMHPTQIL